MRELPLSKGYVTLVDDDVYEWASLVSWQAKTDRRKALSKWAASIRVDGKLLHLGYYGNEVEAAKAYDEAAIKHFGEYAKLNFARG